MADAYIAPRTHTFEKRTGIRCLICGRRVRLSGCPEHGRAIELSPNVVEPLADDTTLVSGVTPPAEQIPGYRTQYVLGRGGFGEVHAARPEAGGPLVAIKVARRGLPEAALRLHREIEVLSEVGPPYVPALLGSGSLAGGTPYLTMELVTSPTLAEHILRWQGPMPARNACTLVLAVCRALEGVHARGYVHRDLKPENVFVDDAAEHAVLVDFGLAKAASPGSSVTAPGGVVGTTEYMAPEQCEGRTDVDARTDIYSMGVILYELLTGRPPFFGPAPVVRDSHISQRPPRPSAIATGSGRLTIPAALEDLVLRCLAKDPAMRFSDATELKAALAEILALPASQWVAVPSARTSSESHAEPLSGRPPAVVAAERRIVSVLCFESPLDAIALRRWFEPAGAQLVHTASRRHVIAFGHEAGENPVRRARLAADELIARGACDRVALDLATVTVKMHPDGTSRILAPRIARSDRFPQYEGPAGVILSNAARAVLVASGAAPELTPSEPSGEVESSAPGSSPAASVRSTRLFGRDATLDALMRAAGRATRQQTPSIAVVLAEAGYGKTRLRRVLVERLRSAIPSGLVLDLQAHEPVGGTASRSVRELLQQALGLPENAPADGGRALLHACLGPSRYTDAGAAIALALGWISRGPEPSDAWVCSGARSLSAIEAAPGAIRTQLTVSAGEAIRRRALRQPLCVIIDDVHFADDATLAILEHATRAQERAPIFVCALGRPLFDDNHPSWGAHAAAREVHHIGPLDPASAAALCRELLQPAENVPESAVQRIIDRTQAIPLLITELVRGLQTHGVVRRRPCGSGFYLATDELDTVPDLPLIEWLANRELDALPASSKAHARLTAVLGAALTVDEMDGVLRRLDRTGEGAEFPLDTRVGVERLIRAGLLKRIGQDGFGFRHALIREAIARGVPEGLRHKIHLAAVEHYREIVRPDDERNLRQLAYHAARAGHRTLAEDAYLALADMARAEHDYLDAEHFYTRALEQTLDTADRGRQSSALRGRGLMRYRLGRYADALADFTLAREAVAAAGDVLAEIEILLDEATALDWMADYEASRHRVEKAHALACGKVPPALEARLLLGRGRSLHRFSQEEDAVRRIERALQVADRLGEEAYETRVIALLLLGFILQGLARLPDAAAALDRAISLCEEHSDSLHFATAINNRALLAACLGDKARMVADFELVLSLGRELGQDWLEIAGHFNLGEYLYLWDELEAAERHVEQALRLELRHTGGSPRPVVELLAARVRLYRGDIEGARALAAQIRTRAGGDGTLPVPAEDVLCAMIEHATSDACEPMWDALERRSERFSIGQERLEVIEARALAALRHGRAQNARRHIDRAIEIARTIPNVMQDRLNKLAHCISQHECGTSEHLPPDGPRGSL